MNAYLVTQKYICEDRAIIKAKTRYQAEEIYKDLMTGKSTHITKTYSLKVRPLQGSGGSR